MPFLVARFAVRCVEGVNFSSPAMHRLCGFVVEKVFPRFDAFSDFMPFSGGFHRNIQLGLLHQ